MFGEEYTLACADYVLSKTRGYVSNMSSRALRDVTNRPGSYEASAVGEVNVVDLMKKIMPS
jgi:phosphomannomutase